MRWPFAICRQHLNAERPKLHRAHCQLVARALAGVVAACLPLVAWAVPLAPSGGCPQPPNALVITEFSQGSGDLPRWVEITNPGKFALALAKVHLLVTSKVGPTSPVKPDKISEFDLGALLQELPAGDMVAVGFVPNSGGVANLLLKTKVLALPPEFVVPCAAKLSLEGPNGLVDEVTWDLCGAKDNKGVWNLDPSQLDICKNNTLATWCQPIGDLTALGTPAKANVACDLDGDGYPSVSANGAQADCNDMNKQVFPGALEVCNGVDDDCNGQTDDDLTPPPNQCYVTGWCAEPPEPGKPVAQCDANFGWGCHYKAGYESNTETQCDLVDNDCDGLTDEGLTNACGKCGPALPELCNGVDDDCDGATDNGTILPQDCTSVGVCTDAKTSCVAGKPVCAMPPAWEATETLCDNLDNDCDGQTDEELGLGATCTKGTGACTGTGVQTCGGTAKVICTAQERKPSQELCGDALDNNCDGFTDEKFNVGQQCEAGKGVCRVVGKVVCSADKLADICNVKPLAAKGQEVCANALDDDCDGQTDETPCEDAAHGVKCSAGHTAQPFGSLLVLLLGLVAATTLLRRSTR